MKIKLDENIPATLGPVLIGLGHEVDTVPDQGLTGQRDERVWEAAQREGRFLITQDLDFSDVRRFAPGTRTGILLIRLRLPGRTALIRRLEAVFHQEDTSQWRMCFVLLTDRKIRIKRPTR